MAVDTCIHQVPILSRGPGAQDVACHLYDGKDKAEAGAVRKEVAFQRQQQQSDMLDRFIDSLDFDN
jgi:hypothetical protein